MMGGLSMVRMWFLQFPWRRTAGNRTPGAHDPPAAHVHNSFVPGGDRYERVAHFTWRGRVKAMLLPLRSAEV
jgi:hypothetical protein